MGGTNDHVPKRRLINRDTHRDVSLIVKFLLCRQDADIDRAPAPRDVETSHPLPYEGIFPEDVLRPRRYTAIETSNYR